GVDQAEAARQVLTSGRRVEALVGPAGTGKTHTMATVAGVWQAAGGAVLGLAVAETAARTLAADSGIATVNTAKLLFEHAPRTRTEQLDRGGRGGTASSRGCWSSSTWGRPVAAACQPRAHVEGLPSGTTE
ncbi:MAG TPA: AAA family ATPase, partial [Acidimicrobiales bacterium]|nr:AAA family ATPase [Acidimicrobiales bacterium]